MPALDCHTGAAPDLDATVPVDHWVLLSTDQALAGWGEPVDYPPAMRHNLRTFLTGDLDRITRLQPPRR